MATTGIFRNHRVPLINKPTALLRYIYWKEYTASEPAYRQYVEGSDIDRLKVSLVYKKRKEEGLWWWASSAASLSNKGRIRHAYSRTLKRAFEDALKAKGFTLDGKRESADDDLKPLMGTLQLLGTRAIGDDKWNELPQFCEDIINHLVQLNTGRGKVRTEGLQPGQRFVKRRPREPKYRDVFKRAEAEALGKKGEQRTAGPTHRSVKLTK